ncbi:MAG: mechanosensitive ion channel domain-containing protein, partial [Candidatus Binatia bacterium]
LFSVWADVFPALRFFEKVEMWSVEGTVEQTVGTGDAARVESLPVRVPVTLANLMIALLGAVLAVVGARNLPGVLELTVLSRLGLDRGLRYAIAMVSRYTVFVVGAVVAFDNLGVGWSKVQWLVAAVSVGLGFGLQEIFGNFVSGLIILFERPVRVGDMVTIDGMTGTVHRIEMRATTILDFDRKELIVPNKDLITGKLLNWSLHDPMVRIVIPVGVAYGSDTTAVQRILLEVAQQCATVLVSPAPIAAFTAFGDSALEFELRVYLTSSDHLVTARHEILMGIDRRFRGAGIEIPFPQRDLHVKSVDAAMATTLAGSRQAGPAASGSHSERTAGRAAEANAG